MTTDVINVPRELRAVLSMILSALDRDAEEGKAARGEMAAELRAALLATAQPADEREAFCDGHCTWLDHHPSCVRATAQPAADVEREAFKRQHASLDLSEKPDAWGRPQFLHSHVETCWLGWQARAAQPQQAVAVTEEVRRLREALERAKDHLSHARHDVEVRANAGNEAARLVLAGIDHWLAQEATHKTGEEG